MLKQKRNQGMVVYVCNLSGGGRGSRDRFLLVTVDLELGVSN